MMYGPWPIALVEMVIRRRGLFQIRSGANTPVPQESTSKGSTNYFEEQQDLLKVRLS